ncbi:MAG: hypothetical protein AB7Q29_14805 [Vicinamibacterales bacterium]
MKTYISGPSVLHLAGHPEPIQPGSLFLHDFSAQGPDGEHGPAREAALLAGGAIALAGLVEAAAAPGVGLPADTEIPIPTVNPDAVQDATVAPIEPASDSGARKSRRSKKE